MNDGVTAMALILIASFAIDRIVTAVLFPFLVWGALPDAKLESDPTEKIKAQRRYKMVYYTLAGLLGVIVLAYFGQIRLLSTLLPSVDPRVDILVTGIALMGGADRIAGWVKAPDSDGGSQEATPTPIQVTGTLTLEPGSGKPPVP